MMAKMAVKETIIQLYQKLYDAKLLQALLVNDYGSEISPESRQEIVKVWNCIDSSIESMCKISNIEHIKIELHVTYL